VRVLDRSLSRLPRTVRTLVDWGITLLAVSFAVLVFQAEVAKPYRIPSASMEPTLHCKRPATACEGRFSDRVIANRLVYRFGDPKRGDIVVFQAPSTAAAAGCGRGATIKRIVGLPGETVSMQDGLVLIDGEPLHEPYLRPAYRGRQTGAWSRVPADAYFVLGDNRALSCDSRSWGVVPREAIVGRAELTYWPPGRAGRTG
jgi:signal peptidase I